MSLDQPNHILQHTNVDLEAFEASKASLLVQENNKDNGRQHRLSSIVSLDDEEDELLRKGTKGYLSFFKITKMIKSGNIF